MRTCPRWALARQEHSKPLQGTSGQRVTAERTTWHPHVHTRISPSPRLVCQILPVAETMYFQGKKGSSFMSQEREVNKKWPKWASSSFQELV